MNTDTFGIELRDRDEHGPHQFVKTISIMIEVEPIPFSSEHTEVTISKKELKSNVLLARVVVEHPAGVILDANNWAGYFHLNVINSDKSRVVTRKIIIGAGCRAIFAYPSFGYYYFQLDCIDGWYGILVNRPKGTIRPMRSLSGKPGYPSMATVIKSPFDAIWSFGKVHYNDKGIYFNRNFERALGRADERKYTARFKRPLSCQEIAKIYVEGFRSLNLKTCFDTTVRDEFDLHFYSDSGFEYFESFDRKVVFTLQETPTVIAFRMLNKLLEEGKIFEKDLTSIMKYFVTGGRDDPEKIRETLRLSLDLLHKATTLA